jgi:hypothetical protein
MKRYPMKFTIRDLLLLAAIVVTLAVWWIDRTRLQALSKYTQQEMRELLSAKNHLREVDAELKKRGLGVHIQGGRVVILPENGVYPPNYSTPPTPAYPVRP